MASPRVSTPRLLAYLGLGSLALLLGALGLLWIVFYQYVWLTKLPDWEVSSYLRNTSVRLWEWRLTRPAADSDGDGVPDWFESGTGQDPQNALGGFPVKVMPSRFFLFRGERTRLQLSLYFNSYRDVRWPIDNEVTVSADSPILLARDAGSEAAPSVGPLRIKSSPEGYVECDILWNVATDTERIRVVQTRNGRQVGDPFEIRAAGWRLPERPSWIRMRSPDIDGPYVPYVLAEPNKYFGPPPLAPHLEWEPPPEKETICMVEVARADVPDDWRDDSLTSPNSSPAVVTHGLGHYSFWGYKGKLLYRVVPVSPTKPETPSPN